MKTKTLQRHPLSAVFAQYDLEGQPLFELAADIQEHGIREPIKLYKGQVLDGWNRYMASQMAKVAPFTIDVGDDEPDFDPWHYVLSANVHRRHMTASDIASVYLLREQQFHGEPSSAVPNGTPSSAVPFGTPKTSVRKLVKELGVGQGTAQRLAKVGNDAVDEVKQAVIDRSVSLDDAAKIAALPKDRQADALKAPRKPKDKAAPISADDQLMNDAYGDDDLSLELERVTKDYQAALKTIAALQKDDDKKQIVTLMDTISGLESRLQDKMVAIDTLNKERAKDARILTELCKLFDVDHPRKLVAAVKSTKETT